MLFSRELNEIVIVTEASYILFSLSEKIELRKIITTREVSTRY